MCVSCSRRGRGTDRIGRGVCGGEKVEGDRGGNDAEDSWGTGSEERATEGESG